MTIEIVIPDIVRKDNALHVTRRSLLAYVDFRRFLCGQFLSQVGDAMTTVVVASVIVFGADAGPVRSRLLNMALTAAVPLLLAGPLAGVVTDRLSRRRILVGGQAVRIVNSVAALAAILLGPTELFFVVFATQLCMNRVMYNARAASLRHLVRQHELVAADSLMFIVGPIAATVGGVIAITGVRWAIAPSVVLVAILNLVSLVVYSRIETVLGGGPEHETAPWAATREHFRDSKYRYAVLSTSLFRVIFGMAYASAVLAVDARLHNAGASYAMVLSLSGIGGFVGSMMAEWANELIPRKTLAVISYVAAAMTSSVAAVTGSLFAIGLFVMAASLVFQILRICSDATVQSNATRGAGGREFAVYDITHNLAFVVGIIVALTVTSSPDSSTLISASSLLFGASAIVVAVARRAQDARSTSISASKAISSKLIRSRAV